MDVLFSNQGQRYQGVSYIKGELIINEDTTYLNIPVDYTARTTLNYLKVPAYFYFNTDPDAKVFFTAFLGPQVNLLISYKERLDGTVETGFFLALQPLVRRLEARRSSMRKLKERGSSQSPLTEAFCLG